MAMSMMIAPTAGGGLITMVPTAVATPVARFNVQSWLTVGVPTAVVT